ncbi:MAG: flagellar biosynthesis protein FlhF [Desulfobacterales bacterium GWB2_56_26]|nr:MAG: flagellar biosynthesis protein FlhF [Desulfobacterales bacterium GWB2_56_26]
MQVRVFEAADMTSGLKLVKKELGPDALILSTRTIKSGKLGLIGKPVLEITAAVDTDYPKEKVFERPAAAMPAPGPSNSGRKSSGFRHTVGDSVEQYLLQRGAESADTAVPAQHLDTPRAVAGRDGKLQNEVDELKDLVKNLAGQIAQLAEKEVSVSKQDNQLKVTSVGPERRFNAPALHGDYILSTLVDRGINIETSRTIAGFLRESYTEQELGNHDRIRAMIVATIQDLLHVAPPIFQDRTTQHRIALVGPTGVGKTTTLAKIAASYLGSHSSSIALITIDTYRIAAVEQLKVYGEIMHLPVEVVISPEQLEAALETHRNKELILIDTAGRSPRDSLCIKELSSFLRPEFGIDKHLVLSATTREQELLDTIERFKGLGITHTIFTKIDECANLGILLNVQIQNANPLSYITNGQRVPEDILEVTPKTAAEMIMSLQEGSMHE